MRCFLAGVGAALMLATLVVPSRAADEAAGSAYYPLKVGTRWTYRVNGDKLITTQVARHEKIKDVLCAAVEASVDGKVTATEHIAAAKDGMYRYAFNKQEANPAVRFLALPPKKGESWMFQTVIGEETVKGTYTAGEAEVEVKAGKYKAVTTQAEFETNNQKVSIETWYAENVGMVKQIMKLGTVEIRLELEKFEEGK